MKTMRIVILDEDGDAAAAHRAAGLPGVDLHELARLSGADAAALLRLHSMPAPFVDTHTNTPSGPDSLGGPPTDFSATDFEHELRSALQVSAAGQPMALLLGNNDAAESPAPAAAAGAPLPFERINASLQRALRRHELEAALAESEARLRRMGLADRLTGLPSRELLLDRLEQAAAAVMRGGNSFATLMIGFEWPQMEPGRWSAVVGSASADALVGTLARRLQRLGRRSDSYARIGGHSFAALLLGNHSVGGAMAMAHKIAEQLARPVMVDGRSLDPSVCIGVALCPQHGTDARSVLLHAQAAMEQARHGRSPVAVYDARHHRSSHPQAREEATAMAPGDEALAPLLAAAIERRQIGLAFQPVVDLQAGADGSLDWSLRRLEALARWHHPTHGHIAPAVFIPVAEHHALIGQLTDSLLEQALTAATPWRQLGLVRSISLNLSAQLLEDTDLPERVQAALTAHQWPGEALLLEVSASALAQTSPQAQGVLARLGRLGVKLVIDDFGSGLGAYLTLAELGTLAELKVDLRSLRQAAASAESVTTPGTLGAPGTADGTRNDRSAAVLKSLITLAKGLGAEVVAKAVEDAGTATWLQQLGCHAAQGHAWSRPLPAEQVRAWCAAQRATRAIKG